MPSANFTKTELAYAIPTVWVQEGLRKLVGNLIVAKLVNRDYKNELKNFGDTINVRKPMTFTVNDKAADTAVTYQAATGTNATVTLNKYKEVSFRADDVAVIESMTGTWEQILSDGMAEMAIQLDKDLIAEAANFTGTTVGTQGTAANAASVRLAQKYLMDAKVVGDTNLIIGTQTWYDLMGQDLFVQAQQRGDNAPLATGIFGKVFGFQSGVSQYVDRTGSPAGDKNLAFSPAALTLASRPLPIPDPQSGAVGAYGDYDGVSMRIVKAWSQDHQAYSVVISSLYGPKAIRPELGLKMYGA